MYIHFILQVVVCVFIRKWPNTKVNNANLVYSPNNELNHTILMYHLRKFTKDTDSFSWRRFSVRKSLPLVPGVSVLRGAEGAEGQTEQGAVGRVQRLDLSWTCPIGSPV